MKTFIITLILVFGMSTFQAQNVVQLDEAKVGFNPLSEIPGNIKQISVNIRENVPGEFERDALAFLKANFDISPYLIKSPDLEFDSYQVVFKSRKGQLLADFDKEGNLVQTSQKFKNIALPKTLSQQLYKDHKGWSMVKNKFVAYGKMDKIDKAVYRISMQNGKQKKNLKFKITPETGSTIVAAN